VDDEDDGRQRGDEPEYRPWWMSEKDCARMRKLESEANELDEQLNGKRTHEIPSESQR
jgi:hypothetical protein